MNLIIKKEEKKIKEIKKQPELLFASTQKTNIDRNLIDKVLMPQNLKFLLICPFKDVGETNKKHEEFEKNYDEEQN